MKASKLKIPKTAREIKFEKSHGPVFSDEVYEMNGYNLRLIDIHARPIKKATPKDG